MRNGHYISPFLLQLLGVLILVGAVAFWAVTGRQSQLIVGAAMMLIGLGAWARIRITLNGRTGGGLPKPKYDDGRGGTDDLDLPE